LNATKSLFANLESRTIQWFMCLKVPHGNFFKMLSNFASTLINLFCNICRSGLHSNSRSDNQAFPGKDKLPMNLLLTPVNFDLFFSLMKSLTELRGTNEHGQPVMLVKAQILSRRVWDILVCLICLVKAFLIACLTLFLILMSADAFTHQ